MEEKAVVTNEKLVKPKYTFLLHLLTGCLIFYGLMSNANPAIQQNAKAESTQTFYTETVGFNEGELFDEAINEEESLFNFIVPAPYTGKQVELQTSSKN